MVSLLRFVCAGCAVLLFSSSVRAADDEFVRALKLLSADYRNWEGEVINSPNQSVQRFEKFRKSDFKDNNLIDLQKSSVPLVAVWKEAVQSWMDGQVTAKEASDSIEAGINNGLNEDFAAHLRLVREQLKKAKDKQDKLNCAIAMKAYAEIELVRQMSAVVAELKKGAGKEAEQKTVELRGTNRMRLGRVPGRR